MSTPSTVAIAFAGLVVLLAIVVLALRSQRRSTERLAATVSRYESALAALSGKLGLKLERPAPYAHPIAGSIPAWPSADGTVDSLEVAVGAHSDDGESPVTYRTRLRLGAPAGARLRAAGSKLKLPRDRDKLGVDPQLAAELAALAERLEVTETQLLIFGRPTPGQHGGQTYVFKLVLDEEALIRLVRAGVSLSRALAG